MLDLKTELQSLVDRYQLQDGMSRIQLTNQLEEVFFERLHLNLLMGLDEPTRQRLMADNNITPQDYFDQLYQHNDTDRIIQQTFESIKDEFLNNMV